MTITNHEIDRTASTDNSTQWLTDGLQVTDNLGNLIATLQSFGAWRGDGSQYRHPLIRIANARLLAAAPMLLEALLDALPYVEDVLGNPEQLGCFKKGLVQRHAKAIRTAIAKATDDSIGRVV